MRWNPSREEASITFINSYCSYCRTFFLLISVIFPFPFNPKQIMRKEIIAMNYEEKNLVESKCIKQVETKLFFKLELP